jgi:hypothetical protein
VIVESKSAKLAMAKKKKKKKKLINKIFEKKKKNPKFKRQVQESDANFFMIFDVSYCSPKPHHLQMSFFTIYYMVIQWTFSSFFFGFPFVEQSTTL